MGIAFCQAINRTGEHTCRLITKQERYGIDFEKDLHLPDLDGSGLDEIEELLTSSDIFHFHILSDESMEIGPLRVRDYIRGKGLVNHHHGHPDFRANPGKYREKYRELNRRTLVSTPDLLKLLPEACWIPNVVPVNDPRFMPTGKQAKGKVRICQSPTKKELKNTSEFIAVVDELKGRYPHIECVVIENTVYDTCLSIKRSSDIHFDHMQGYYGVSSLESLSQGKPVIAGLDDWNIGHIQSFSGRTKLPWCIARSRVELRDTLSELIEDPGLRKTRGEEAREFMVNCWNEANVLGILMDVYATL